MGRKVGADVFCTLLASRGRQRCGAVSAEFAGFSGRWSGECPIREILVDRLARETRKTSFCVAPSARVSKLRTSLREIEKIVYLLK